MRLRRIEGSTVRREMETLHSEISAEALEWPEFIDPYEQNRITWPDYVAKWTVPPGSGKK